MRILAKSCACIAGAVGVQMGLAQESSLIRLAQLEAVSGSPRLVAVDGARCIVSSSTQLALIDLTDPASPSVTGRLTVDDPYSLALSGSVAAYVDSDRAVRLVDLTNPAAPTHGSVIPYRDLNGLEYRFGSIDFSGQYLLAISAGDLVSFSVPNAYQATQLGDAGTGYSIYGLSVSGDRAFALAWFVNSSYDGAARWAIFDVSNPAQPQWCAPDAWSGFVDDYHLAYDRGGGIASHGRKAIGFASPPFVSQIYSTLAIDGQCPPDDVQRVFHTWRPIYSVAADNQYYYRSQRVDGRDMLTAEPHSDDGDCGPLADVRFWAMDANAGVIVGVSDSRADVTVVQRVDLGPRRIWASPESGDFVNPDQWSPAAPPGDDAEVVFPLVFPDGGGPQQAAYSVSLDSPGATVASLTVEANDVSIVADFFNDPAELLITDQLNIAGGMLAIAGDADPAVGVDARLILPATPGSFSSAGGPLVVQPGARVSAFPGDALARGDQVRLEGACVGCSEEGLPHVESDVSLDSWGGVDPTDANGAPQLTVNGSGRVLGDLDNSGWLRLGDDGGGFGLLVEGDYRQRASGVLEVVLGNGSGSEGAVTPLRVTGEAMINGTLRIRRAPGYTATAGDYFTIVIAEDGLDLRGDSPGDADYGFAAIEGIRDTGPTGSAAADELFWGIDYNTRDDNRQVIEVVALRVPRRLVPGNTTVPLTDTGKRNMVIITHGTGGNVDAPTPPVQGPPSPLLRVARRFQEFADTRGILHRWDTVVLDWKEFATNPNPVSSGFACSNGTGPDAKGRGFDPYEAARFGEQYARSLAFFLADPSVGVDLGQRDSVHLLAHSSGSYLINMLAKILDASWSPFTGKPDETHVTYFDSYLAPQGGGLSLGCQDWEGPPLSVLGFSGDTTEQYFNDDHLTVPNTNNKPVMQGGTVNFEVTLVPDSYQSGGAGHGYPQEYYADSIKWFIDPARPPSVPVEPGLPLAELYSLAGGIYSPMFADAGIGQSLSSIDAPSSETSDGDIDLVRVQLEYNILLDTFSYEYVLNGSVVVNANGQQIIFGGASPRPGPEGSGGAPDSVDIAGAARSDMDAVALSLTVSEDAAGTLRVFVDGDLLESVAVPSSRAPVGQSEWSAQVAASPTATTMIRLEYESSGPGSLTIDDPRLEALAYDVGPACDADVAGPDGTLNIDDVLAFLIAFNEGDPVADFSGDGLFNIDDVLGFLQAFNRGCPD